MTINFFRHQWQKVLFAILLFFLFVITVVAFFVNRYWSPILADKLRNTVFASSDNLYEADFTNADLHIVQGKLVIHSLTLKPNYTVYKKRLAAGLAPNNLYTLKVKRIVFKNIHPLKLYFHKKLDIGQIILSEPHLQVSYQLNHRHDTVNKNQLTAWQRIKPILNSIHIGKVLLNDVKLKYKDYSGNVLNITELKEMNLLGKDLLIDSNTQNQASRFYYFKDVQAELNNFSQASGNGLYQYKIKQLRYSTLSAQLHAFGVGLIPAHDSVFVKRKVRAWFMFNTDTLQLNKFDFKKYNKYRLLNACKLLLRRGNLVVFANPGSKPKKGDRLITFPNQAVKQLKNRFTLDTVELHRIHITYKGYGKKSHKQGMVSYNNTNGYIYNVTNNPDAFKRNNITSIHLTSYLMDSGPLEADITFNLTDSARSYTYKGSVGYMNLENFNKAVMPFGLVKITSGQLEKFSFDFKANRYITKGNVTFLYHNLKVHILKMDTVAQKYKHRAIASLLANALIVKRNNPDYLGAIPRTFHIEYIRQPDTPFFKALWKPLAMGIKASAGYDEATEQEVKQHIARHMADKRRRQIKKALRQKRRDMRKESRN